MFVLLSRCRSSRRRAVVGSPRAAGALAFWLLVSVLTLAFAAGQAHAVTTSVDLGTAEEYSVLSGVSVTSTGATAMSESLGSVLPAVLVNAVDGGSAAGG